MMQYRQLGNSDLRVSALCLGTMTFGEQNDQAQAFEQLDFALDTGINFIDSAEMYPVPARAETQGHTERIIGNWRQQLPEPQQYRDRCERKSTPPANGLH